MTFSSHAFTQAINQHDMLYHEKDFFFFRIFNLSETGNSGIPRIFRDRENPRNHNNPRDSREFFSGMFPELDYFAIFSDF